MSDQSLAQLAAFVAVVDAGGFTAAARETGLRKATLSERVRDLEARLGARLLERTTRTVRLTEAGRLLHGGASRALREARVAEESVREAADVPTGTLRVSASEALVALLFDPVIVPFLVDFPAVRLELDTSPRRVDLAREDYDLALRVGRLEDSGLGARRLGVISGTYAASPAYLAARGVPRTPDDLVHHDLLTIRAAPGPIEWRFAENGAPRLVPVTPRAIFPSFELVARAALSGLGVARAPTVYLQAGLASGALVRLLEAYTEAPIAMHAVSPSPGRLPPKARVFVERVAAWFAER